MLLGIWKWNKKCALPWKIGHRPNPPFQQFFSFSADYQLVWHIATFPGFNFDKECIDRHFVIYFFIYRYFWILEETISSGTRLILGNLTARFSCKKERTIKWDGWRRKSKKVGITRLTRFYFTRKNNNYTPVLI